jgi:acyl-CoA thioesterase
VVELKTTRELCNDLGKVHGGAIFTLADAALAAASNSRPGELAVAITGTIHFLRSAGPGELLRAEAVEERRGGRLGSYRIVVSRDDEEIATALASTLLVGTRDAP